MNKTADFLKATKTFQGLSPDQRMEAAALFSKISLKQGDTVISMGHESDSIFIIKKGQCKVSIPFNFNLGENILTYLKEGQLIGEMGVISGNRRAANIICNTDVELLHMTGSDFWKIANKYNIILKNIISILSERLAVQNEGRKSSGRAPLNLSPEQRKELDYFYGHIDEHSRKLINLQTDIDVPPRKALSSPAAYIKRAINRGIRFLINIITAPYISKIEGVENIPKEKSVIYLLSFRTYFDFLFFFKVLQKTGSRRAITFAVNLSLMGNRIYRFLGTGVFHILDFSYLRKDYKDPLNGAEDPLNLLKTHTVPEKMVDVALHPFLGKSMRYDIAMEHDHLKIWLNSGCEMEIVPVAISGTDKFWPFEPWNRKFFNITAFFTRNFVEIKIGERISLEKSGFREKIDECGGDQEKIRTFFDEVNRDIGNRMAALEGHKYVPLHKDSELDLLRPFNETWSNRLSHMLPTGVALRRKHGKLSIKIRHCLWHAEMLNVLFEYLREEGYILPDWAKGMMIAGASYADVEWPFFSMDHSYNPFTRQGMKLVIRFPDLMSRTKKEISELFASLDNDTEIDKILNRIGKTYHLMTDLAVPSHVHNIPHMFLDVPKIGKCDFEEYLGLDSQLLKLSNTEIADISAVKIGSFNDFYKSLDYMARYTFLNSSFDYEGLKTIARERMITEFDGKKDLINKLRKMGVAVWRAEGLENEERYYVRNLTTSQCDEIGDKTTFYSLKILASCFIFLISSVNGKLRGESA